MKNKDIAQEAYEAANICIKTEFQDNQDATAILCGSARSMEDVQRLVETAQTHYVNSCKDKKAAKWLRRFSARITYYGQVLDVLAQHHPEYLALAWGTVKFVFLGILNHDRLVQEFSKALSRIGDALPQVAIAAELYKTDRMCNAVSRLYVTILRFFLQALRWYNKGRIGRAFSALFNPYELEYQDTVEQIRTCTSTIQHIATAESQCEVRDLNVELGIIRTDQTTLIAKVDSIMKLATSSKTINERVDINVQDMMPRIRDIQFSQVLSNLQPANCPHDTLHRLQSIVKRSRSRRLPEVEPKDIVHSFNSWLSKQGSSMFILRVGPRAESKARELTTDLISTLQNRRLNVIWRIPHPQTTTEMEPTSFAEVLRLLTHQILILQPSLLHPHTLDTAKFQATQTAAEWTRLFQHLLCQLSSCYIILETHDLLQVQAANTEFDWLPNILKLFQDLAVQATSNGHTLKFLVLCYGSQSNAFADFGDIQATLRKPAVVPVSRRGVVAHRKGVRGWMRVLPKL